MRLALISDIHGNYTALQSVLADIKENNVDRIVCLGDVATLSAQPNQIIEKLIAKQLTLKQSHPDIKEIIEALLLYYAILRENRLLFDLTDLNNEIVVHTLHQI